jgi:hypothetical protein
MKVKFLDLGMQPIANGFIEKDSYEKEFFYNLSMGFDEDTCLVSQMEFVEPEMMFNDSYVYHSSLSSTMRDHFKLAAETFSREFRCENILEIGSNDGVFLKHFSTESATSVEPCGNFAQMTEELGYKTYCNFWDLSLSKKIVEQNGKMDLIFAANCMCHIQDIHETFLAVKNCMSDEGVFIFEDPSLLRMIERGSYDQLYDEHVHMFSVIALSNIFEKIGMEIFKVENLSVHGGSNRIYVKSIENSEIKIDDSVLESIREEKIAGLSTAGAYFDFADRVKRSKEELVSILKEAKAQGKKIVSYGATSKSTTVFNYCQITPEIIDYIVDITPGKQGKMSPGVHIPVVEYSSMFDSSVDVAFLGAWNYIDEISNKEIDFLKNGGEFITHVPEVMRISENNV